MALCEGIVLEEALGLSSDRILNDDMYVCTRPNNIFTILFFVFKCVFVVFKISNNEETHNKYSR